MERNHVYCVVSPTLKKRTKKKYLAFLLQGCGWCRQLERERLTQADVVGERLQEAVTLLSAAAAGRARAPWSHSGRGVVHIVGRYCASCPEKGVGIKYSSMCVMLVLSEMLMEPSGSRKREAALRD